MKKNIVKCLFCNKEFLLTEYEGDFIIRCPYCEFSHVYLSKEHTLSVPTQIEEDTLETLDGIPIQDEINENYIDDDRTISQTSFNLQEIPAPSSVTLIMEVVKGRDKGKVFNIKKSLSTIGRKDCDIVLDDSLVSRKHASLEMISKDNIYIRDLASRNGIFINGKQITMKKLYGNELLRLGNTEIKIIIEK